MIKEKTNSLPKQVMSKTGAINQQTGLIVAVKRGDQHLLQSSEDGRMVVRAGRYSATLSIWNPRPEPIVFSIGTWGSNGKKSFVFGHEKNISAPRHGKILSSGGFYGMPLPEIIDLSGLEVFSWGVGWSLLRADRSGIVHLDDSGLSPTGSSVSRLTVSVI